MTTDGSIFADQSGYSLVGGGSGYDTTNTYNTAPTTDYTSANTTTSYDSYTPSFSIQNAYAADSSQYQPSYFEYASALSSGYGSITNSLFGNSPYAYEGSPTSSLLNSGGFLGGKALDSAIGQQANGESEKSDWGKIIGSITAKPEAWFLGVSVIGNLLKGLFPSDTEKATAKRAEAEARLADANVNVAKANTEYTNQKAQTEESKRNFGNSVPVVSFGHTGSTGKNRLRTQKPSRFMKG